MSCPQMSGARSGFRRTISRRDRGIGGRRSIRPSWHYYFAPDIPTSDAQVLAAVQHPIALGVLAAVAGEPGWKTIPS